LVQIVDGLLPIAMNNPVMTPVAARTPMRKSVISHQVNFFRIACQRDSARSSGDRAEALACLADARPLARGLADPRVATAIGGTPGAWICKKRGRAALLGSLDRIRAQPSAGRQGV
jgi:hypothetical protein